MPSSTNSRSPRFVQVAEHFGTPARRARALDADRLLFAAKKEAGLHDFGDGSFREGFDRLLAELSALDDLSARTAAVLARTVEHRLVVRLRVRNEWKRNEAAEYETVRRPLLLVGLPGSGLTRFGRLLAQDPLSRAVDGAEALDPIPVRQLGERGSDATPAQRVAPQRSGAPRLAPGFARSLGPVDDASLAAGAFHLPHIELVADLPEYQAWLRTAGIAPAMAHHRRVLALFQTAVPVERWLLRSAWHLHHLRDVAATYPDAHVVWLHRDPAAALANRIGAVVDQRRGLGIDVSPATIARQATTDSAAAVAAALASIDAWPDTQVFHLQYAEVGEDPVGAVERVYRHFGLTLPDVARMRMQVWAGNHPVRPRPVQPDIAAAVHTDGVRLAHADYIATHHVPTESLT